MTQSEMADILNITQAYLSEIERGKKAPSNTLLLDMARKFNTTVSYLLGETNSVTLPDSVHVLENCSKNIPPAEIKPDYIVIPILPVSEIIESCKTSLINKKPTAYIGLPASDAGDYISENNPPFALDIDMVIRPAHGIPAESRIIVNPEEKVRDFDVVLIYYKKQLALKKIMTKNDASLKIISHDGSTIGIEEEEIISGEFKILGKVTSVTHKPAHGL